MNWAGITLLVMNGIGLLLAAHLHGKPKDGEHCFWTSLVATGIALWLYWCAGAFGN